MSINNELDRNELIMLSGTVEHLKIGLGPANLLTGLSGSKAQNIIAIGDALGGHLSGATMAAASANDAIGELEHFACYIGENLVQGVFPNVTFRAGDEVDVVVERSGGKNYVQAISKKAENLLWVPLMREKSIGATFIRSLQHVFWLMLVGYVGWGVFALIDGAQGLDQMERLFLWSIPAAGSLIMGIWDFTASYATGIKSTKVFRILGLPNSNWINLSPYSLLNLENDPYGECVYRFKIPPPA
jgi:hypothetical protein